MDLGDAACTPSHDIRRASIGCDFHSSGTLVWMYCRQGNVVKEFVVISLSYTNCTFGNRETLIHR
jgi:hypothetical protein